MFYAYSRVYRSSLLDKFFNSSKFTHPEKTKTRVSNCLNNQSDLLDLSSLDINGANIEKSVIPLLKEASHVKELKINDNALENKDIALLANACRLNKIDCRRNNVRSGLFEEQINHPNRNLNIITDVRVNGHPRFINFNKG